MAPLEPWEKVLVDAVEYAGDVHAEIECVECHGGQASMDKETAHVGITRNPSSNPEELCGVCHDEIAPMFANSLHANLEGYWSVLEPRGAMRDHPEVGEMFGNHCESCHATCGECHVSQPNLVGGGFVDGHVFNKTPSLTQNCTACHGSRVGNEFLGKHEGLRSDVHFRQARMTCVGCHTGAEIHGEYDQDYGEDGTHNRYQDGQIVACENCHETVGTETDEVEMHGDHAGTLSCQVCHSVSYTSCDGCHVALSETTGNPFFATDDHYLGFWIGLNPLQSDERPYKYVPLRHVPVATDSFSFYGENLMPTFDALPTWKYATPHNIQRNTPQTESCSNCHNNPELFLTADKVMETELNANLGVIVEELPPSVLDLLSSP